MATAYGSNRDVGNSINNCMKLIELFEYRLFKHDAGFKIYMNPSAGDIRTLLKNSYILSKLPNLDLNAPIEKLDDFDDDYVHYGGSIHNLDYPLRGVVADGNVYVVDSYDAEHEELADALQSQGIGTDHENLIPLSFEKQTAAPRGDLEDYKIGAPQLKVGDLKSIPAIQRMKMPVGEWN